MAWRKLCLELILHLHTGEPLQGLGEQAGCCQVGMGAAQGGAGGSLGARSSLAPIPGPALLLPALESSAHPGIGRFLS